MIYFEILLFLLVVSFALSAISLAPYVPTSTKDLPRIHELAKLKKGQVFLEVGTANGKVACYIAKHNPQAKVIGIEYCFPLYLLAKIRKIIGGYNNLHIIYGNIFSYPLHQIDVVYVYGLPESLKNLGKKMSHELKVGSKVLSYVCEITNWKGFVTKNKPEAELLAIYVYEKN